MITRMPDLRGVQAIVSGRGGTRPKGKRLGREEVVRALAEVVNTIWLALHTPLHQYRCVQPASEAMASGNKRMRLWGIEQYHGTFGNWRGVETAQVGRWCFWTGVLKQWQWTGSDVEVVCGTVLNKSPLA